MRTPPAMKRAYIGVSKTSPAIQSGGSPLLHPANATRNGTSANHRAAGRATAADDHGAQRAHLLDRGRGGQDEHHGRNRGAEPPVGVDGVWRHPRLTHSSPA